MSDHHDTTESSPRIPRSILWLGLAVLAIGAFLVWDSKIRDLSREWTKEADRIESSVRTVRNSSALGVQLKKMNETITSVGPVEIPGALAASHDELNRTVNELLKQYRVSDDSFVSRPEGYRPKNTLLEITGGSKRVQTIKGDLDFIATEQDATAIIAALEANPAIELVRSVRLNKMTNDKVKVRLILEAWVLTDRN